MKVTADEILGAKFTEEEQKAANDFAYDLDAYIEGEGPNINDVVLGFYGGINYQKKQLLGLKGWITRDKPGYGNSSGWLRLHFRKPERTTRDWNSKDEFEIDDSQILKDEFFPDLKWENEPVEVELLINKI